MRSRSCAATSPASEVGITLNLDNPYPAGPSDEDAQAARWVDGLHNRWFLDPLFRGSYPEDMLEAWAAILPEIRDGDLETIATPIDFLGVNNYTSPLVAADEHGGRSRIVRRNDVDRTDMGWEVVPQGLHDLLVRLHRDYDPPAIYVTENGAAFPDVRGHDGSVHDPERQSYLEDTSTPRRARSRTACRCAATSRGRCSTTSSGRGATGSASASIYIDYATLERVPKGSFYWYRDFIGGQRVRATGSEEAA